MYESYELTFFWASGSDRHLTPSSLNISPFFVSKSEFKPDDVIKLKIMWEQNSYQI